MLLQRHPGAPLDEVFLDFIYQPITDAHGAVTGVFVQGHDITEQYRQRDEAIRANRAKDEFLATLSHELRTPLNALLGWARILRTQPMDEEGRARAIDVIERNANQQAQLVQDILDISAITTGKLRLRMQPIDLRPVVDAAIDVVQPGADAKGLTIGCTGEATLALTGDPDRLRQVVWNVLANAVKFTPSGGRIDIVLSRRGDEAELAITDTGMGIPAEVLPNIFERFHQAEGQRGRGGLGLGLSIVKHVVEAHGGSVRASSDGPGTGATFVIRLPGKNISQTARQEI